MRIQHNIPALSAYRNYTRNVSMVNKNLERLSSGYKINRAGDDAAGLAISEKMRIQISGLEQAQNNAKSGINLVQTAEGALTEVHDMLNRMYTLAEQSANGTYSDDVDREQLQKEVNSLRTEINRIADATNYNGINLLDGSLSSKGTIASKGTTSTFGDLPNVGETLGVDTVLHKDQGTAVAQTKFAVDLHNVTVKGKQGDTFELKIGDTTLTGKLKGDFSTTALTATQLATALTKGADADANVSFTYADGTAYDGTTGTKLGEAEFDAVTSSGTRVTFKQKTSDTTELNPDMKVELVGDGAAGTPIADVKNTAATDGAAVTVTGGPTTATATDYNAGSGAKATVMIDFSGASLGAAGVMTLEIGGQKIQSAAVADGDKGTATALANAFNGKTFSYGGQTWTASVTGTQVTFAAGTAVAITGGVTGLGTASVTAAADAGTKGKTEIDFSNKTGSQVIGGTVDIGGTKFEFVKTGGTAATGNKAVEVDEDATAAEIATALKDKVAAETITGVDADAATVNDAKVTVESETAGVANDKTKDTAVTDVGGKATVDGDYNVSTTVISKKSDAASERIASTYFTLKKDMVSNGSSIKIGKESYTFTTDKNDNGAGKVYIGDLDDKASDYLTTVAERLSDKAAGNAVYTVGHDGTRITVTENVGAAGTAYDVEKDFDLKTLEGIQKSLGYTSVGAEAKAGTPLTLQIGDTPDDFNKLSVEVKDMHATAMGIGEIDISTQEGASAAMTAIKNATNYVSDVRGDLGALQNRLDHTINNLSVTQENITDAESTIRDVDIAKEMMAYTKNNILVQSAQAMLAQANQLPQGVLQLLG